VRAQLQHFCPTASRQWARILRNKMSCRLFRMESICSGPILNERFRASPMISNERFTAARVRSSDKYEWWVPDRAPKCV
jgi:hypothetical protein